MSRLIYNSTPAERACFCSFAETFESQSLIEDNNGTITSAPVISFGATFDGTDDVITYPEVKNVKTVCFWITLATTTEDIMQLSATHSIEVSGGTLTATGFSSPTIYVNGVATSTITTARSHVMVKTSTGFTADAIKIGQDDSFGEFKIEELKFFSSVLDIYDALAYTNNKMYSYRNRAVLDLPMTNACHDPSNTRTLDVSGYGYHATFGAGALAPVKSTARGYVYDSGDYMQGNSTNIFGLSSTSFAFLCIPGFFMNDGTNHFYMGSSSNNYEIYKTTGNNLRVKLGGTTVIDITLETYRNYFDYGRCSSIIVTAVSGNTRLVINGQLITTSITAWNTAADTLYNIGSRGGTFTYVGTMCRFHSFPFVLSSIQVADLHLTMMRSINEE